MVEEAPQTASDAEPEPDRRGQESRSHAEERSIGELIVGPQREPASGGEERDGRTEDRPDHEGEGDVGNRAGERKHGARDARSRRAPLRVEEEPEPAAEDRGRDGAETDEAGAREHHRQDGLTEPRGGERSHPE